MSYGLTFVDTREGPDSFEALLDVRANVPDSQRPTERVAGFARALAMRWSEDNLLWRGPLSARGPLLEVALDSARFSEVGAELLDMADRAGLACFDPQLNVVIPPTALKATWAGSAWRVKYPTAGPPRLGELQIGFFAAPTDDEYTQIMACLTALRDQLPMAMPATYESKTRIANTFRWEERFLLRDAIRAGSGSWSARPPFTWGGMYELRPRPQRKPGRLARLTLSVDVQALGDPHLQAMLRDGVPAVAGAFGAFYAVGMVPMRLSVADGIPKYIRSDQANTAMRVLASSWPGLPRQHVLLEWFGPIYLPWIGEAIAARGTAASGGLYTDYYTDTDARLQLIPAELLEGTLGTANARFLPDF